MGKTIGINSGTKQREANFSRKNMETGEEEN